MNWKTLDNMLLFLHLWYMAYRSEKQHLHQADTTVVGCFKDSENGSGTVQTREES